ncbi:hypothetical protein HDV00_010571 [Rhizophlyctis rosea]|nr:hypothetical protein HDV00_010571 [Rhizophlyctis rosea]
MDDTKPPAEGSSTPIPVTVFTGFLGAGKTTIILSLIERLPPGYKVVLLKNEFGDVKVDSELARASNIQVTEMLNGCMCCVLVGQMKNALLEIRDTQKPDRIIIETSGSAFPAPIAWQIRELASENFTLDAIITVIDCVNFTGYEDTSYTAKMQAKYTDVILLNKHELVTERQLDLVLDHVYHLNEDTPKLKCEGEHGVSPDLVFGLDTKLFSLAPTASTTKSSTDKEWDGRMDLNHHYQEVDLITVADPPIESEHGCGEGAQCGHVLGHGHEHQHSHDNDDHNPSPLTKESLETFLNTLSKDDIYRVKGLVRLQISASKDELHVLNWAFGRFTLTPIDSTNREDIKVRVTLMGQGLRMVLERVRQGFGVGPGNVLFTPADPRRA